MDNTRSYGLHLTVDGYGADPALLANPDYVTQTLRAVVDLIGMHLLWGPHTEVVTDDSGHEPGVSVMLMIYESHMTIHTYSKKDFFSVDVYSCNMFDYEKVLVHLKEKLKPKELEINTVIRGKQFPKENLHD